MSESDTASVECPLCDEAFDPTAAGGWCTNSECGEWQYEADVTPNQQQDSNEDAGSTHENGDEAGDDADVAADGADLSDVAEPSASADDGDVDGSSSADEWNASASTPDESEPTASDSGESEPGESESTASEPDESEPSDSDADVADEDATTDGRTAADAADDEAADGDDADDETAFDCPGCGASLDADVNFCPDCGEDVGALPADDAAADLDACPSCGADVDADDNFCVQCGENLDAHRGSGVLAECPDCGTDVDDDDAFCVGCGADLNAHRSGAGDDGGRAGADADPTDAAPDALALTAYGKSVVVGDGDAVGREIRSLLTEAGRPEDEAVRVHREHVEFVRESGRFYVVALGENPTRVDGTALSKGDREPVAPGDDIELSDVVTLDVEAA